MIFYISEFYRYPNTLKVSFGYGMKLFRQFCCDRLRSTMYSSIESSYVDSEAVNIHKYSAFIEHRHDLRGTCFRTADGPSEDVSSLQFY